MSQRAGPRPRQGEPRKPTHLSHSSRETLERCARQYLLSRIAGAPSRPALWLAGGSAVHLVTEAYDLRAVISKARGDKEITPPFNLEVGWRTAFEEQLAEARAKEPNENAWRRSSSEPIEVWNQLGPQFVQAYISWRERSPWEIWTTPDGEPAIELDISGMLPGCPVEIKGYVDRVMEDPVFKKLWVLDLKSGKRPPKTAAQFETYAALIKVKYGVDMAGGVAFMNRKATLGKPFDLAEVTPEAVGAVYGEAWEQIEGYMKTGRWPADTSNCFTCDVSAACAAKNGPLAHLYDPDWIPPF